MMIAMLAAAALNCGDYAAVKSAALDRLYPEFGSGYYEAADSVAGETAFRHKVANLRARAAHVKDPCARRAYTEWADFYDQQTNYWSNQRKADERARAVHLEALPRR